MNTKNYFLLFCIVVAALTGCGLRFAGSQQLGFINKEDKIVINLEKYTDANYLNFNSLFLPKVAPEKLAFGVGDFSGGMAVIKFRGLTHPTSFLNENGQLVGAFISADSFSEGLAAVAQESEKGASNWGYVDKKCSWVIPPSYSSAKSFSEGKAAVCMYSGWGYINATGQTVIKPSFDEAESFSEGVAVVKTRGHKGCIDKLGRYVLQPKYDNVFQASNEILVAELACAQKEQTKTCAQNTKLYFDLSGKLLFSKKFGVVNWRYVELDKDSGIKRKQGPSGLTSLNVSRPPTFSEGLAVIQEGEKFGYMDKSGKIVISPVFDYAFNFSEGRAVVYKDIAQGRLAYIDKQGKLITDYKFKYAGTFSEGAAAVCENGFSYGYIAKDGAYVVKPTYSAASSFHEGKAQVGSCSVYF